MWNLKGNIMEDSEQQMYFEIKDAESVAKIDEALKPIQVFDEKLYLLQKKYGADTPFVFNSIDRGLEFCCFLFKELPLHLDTKNEFKLSFNKNESGYELRPRKSNKKFYAEFIKDLENVNYEALKLALFGNTQIRPSITYLKKDQVYILTSCSNIVLPHKELTATQYKNLIK